MRVSYTLLDRLTRINIILKNQIGYYLSYTHGTDMEKEELFKSFRLNLPQ